MKKTTKHSVNLKIRVPRQQRDALNREAARRGVTAAALLREQIQAITGVGDPMRRVARPGQGKRRKKIAA